MPAGGTTAPVSAHKALTCGFVGTNQAMWLEVEDDPVDAYGFHRGVVHYLVVVGADDVGRRTWGHGTNGPLCRRCEVRRMTNSTFFMTLGRELFELWKDGHSDCAGTRLPA